MRVTAIVIAWNPGPRIDACLAALKAYRWPGNVRELLNVLRRATLFAESSVLDGELVRRMIAASVFAHTDAGRLSIPPQPPAPASPSSIPGSGSGVTSLAEVERTHIERVLAARGGNITRAATALGIDRRTLQRKLKSYGIDAE